MSSEQVSTKDPNAEAEAQRVEGKILLLFEELPLKNKLAVLQHLKDEIDDAR